MPEIRRKTKYISLILNHNISHSLETLIHTLSFELQVQCHLTTIVENLYGGKDRVRKDKAKVGTLNVALQKHKVRIKIIKDKSINISQ